MRQHETKLRDLEEGLLREPEDSIAIDLQAMVLVMCINTGHDEGMILRMERLSHHRGHEVNRVLLTSMRLGGVGAAEVTGINDDL